MVYLRPPPIFQRMNIDPTDTSASADARRIAQIRERIARGDEVVTLGTLRSMLRLSGEQLTARDMRRMLHIAEPKPEPKDYFFRILVCAVVGWALTSFVREGSEVWGGVVGIAVVVWLAYSMGVTNGEKINPKPLDLFGFDMPERSSPPRHGALQ